MIIDLTGLSENENEEDDSSSTEEEEENTCQICYNRINSICRYTCCKNVCCMTCFRKIHLENEFLSCPFDRTMPIQVDMDIICVKYHSSENGINGTIYLSPSDPFYKIQERIMVSLPWSTSCCWRQIITHNSKVLEPPPNTSIYMTPLNHGDTIYLKTDVHNPVWVLITQ